MKTYKVIERKSHVMGMPLEDIGVVTIFFSTLIILYNILTLWLPMSKHFLLAIALLSLALLAALRWANKHRQPGFLTSWLAYRLKTPRNIFYHKTIYFLTDDRQTYQKKGQA